MNAVMREPYEVPVVANETIETKLGFLSTSVDEVKADVRALKADNISLREKIDATRTELINLVVQVRTELGNRIDQFRAELGARIDKLDSKFDRLEAAQGTLRENLEKKIEQGDNKLAEKIDALTLAVGQTNVRVAKVATMQKAILWVIGGLASVVVLFSVLFQTGIHFRWW
jgi:chromosome segregation ATPase